MTQRPQLTESGTISAAARADARTRTGISRVMLSRDDAEVAGATFAYSSAHPISSAFVDSYLLSADQKGHKRGV